MLQKPAFALPNLIIIGSQKCGTTSLHAYLGLHPEIFMSKTKELNFFALEGNWHKGIDWYRSNFNGLARINGEASPNYTLYPIWAGIPERMYSVIPEAKLIFLIRDPVERLLAHYVHRFAAGLEDRPLDEVLAVLENNLYVCRSLYYLQLTQFLKFYSLSNILILQQADLKRTRSQTLRQIFQFLDVEADFTSPLTQFEAHRTRDKRRLTSVGRRVAGWPGVKAMDKIPLIGWQLQQAVLLLVSKPVAQPVLDDSLRQRLVEFLKPDADCFRNLTGQSFTSWCL